MEIAADSLYKAKLIRGFCHLYDGQEAVAVGMEAAITKKDCIITAYRHHCIFLCRGGTLLECFAVLMGRRRAGCSKGKGCPQYGRSLGSACHFDGMGTAEWKAAKSPAYFKRGDYVPGLKVDGMDALAVKQACKFAKEHALKNGPIILEMDTYRYHGHSMSDPGSTYAERDPIERIRKLILSHELATEKQLKDIEKQVRKEVQPFRKLAFLSYWLWTSFIFLQFQESPTPDSSELFTNVYVKGLGVEVDFSPLC
ncbi:hypothetical protein F0562_033396 [Nyssa sinensis]|uniref:Dehydrogenase E1 component domain-containing protein n=1 Tax=Nyssa sinensis TaxID=561372 RepID=A0A5J5AVM2_9ASTE|nr:hypothetical protein F0562_033396 [Nyssa sinensis]